MTYQEIESGIEVILFGKYKSLLVNKVDKSYTKVIVMDIDRGKGWSERLQRYVGIKSQHCWVRGQNYSYGTETEVHIKDIELIK